MKLKEERLTNMTRTECRAIYTMKPTVHLILIFCGWALTYLTYVAASSCAGRLIGDPRSSLLASLLIAGAVEITVPVLFCRFIEGRPLLSMGLNRRRVLPEYLIGLAIGLTAFSAVFLTAALTGCAEITGINGFSPVLICFFFAFALQSAGEEILTRGFFMLSLRLRIGRVPALLVSSAVFAAMHIGNSGASVPAIINIAIYGTAAGLLLLRRGSIAMPAGLHAAWNFTQGVIFGAGVSGITDIPSVFASRISGAKILTGGAFGLEASVISTAVFALLTVIFALIPTNKREIPDKFSGNNV